MIYSNIVYLLWLGVLKTIEYSYIQVFVLRIDGYITVLYKVDAL